VAHWELRSDLMRPQLGGPGKAMIVCVSREVCVKIYNTLVDLRPGWEHEVVDKGKMKIVFHGDPSDPEHLRKHALRPSQHRAVQARGQ
jgi:type I restriction enzyme, R subunit